MDKWLESIQITPIFDAMLYSGSKSFTAIVVGIAQEEGLLSIDEYLTDAFCDEFPDAIKENLVVDTVYDLFTMCVAW